MADRLFYSLPPNTPQLPACRSSMIGVLFPSPHSNCYLDFLRSSFFVMIIHQQRSWACFELCREISYKGTGSPEYRSENWEGLVQFKRGDRFQDSRAYWLA
jgi:hypothetical protein